MDTIADDYLLLKRLRNADYQAFDCLFDRYWDVLFRIALQKMDDENHAMDVVQDLFVDLWQRRSRLRIESTLRSYLVSALYYKIFSFFRTQGIREKHVRAYVAGREQLTVATTLLDQDDEACFNEVIRAVEQSTADMPERMRQVFDLKYHQSLSNPEIAENLGISLQTVKNQLSKALSHVRDHMPVQELPYFLLLMVLSPL